MNPSMHHQLALAALSSLFICGQGFAQQKDPANPAVGAVNSPYYVKASEIIGAKVYWPGVPDKGQSALGEVKDLIVDTGRSFGHGVFAVLSDGEIYTLGTDPLQGVCCLRWDEGAKRFVTEDPALRDTAAASADKMERRAAARPDAEPANATDTRRVPSRLVMHSGIKGIKVVPQGAQDSFGKLDDLWIDVRRGCVGFMTVSSGGVLGVGDTTRLVPWQVASLERSLDRKENRLDVRATKESLEAAPKVESKTDINEPTLRANACKHFNCDESYTDRSHLKTEKERMKEK
jgi:hypothetical protein